MSDALSGKSAWEPPDGLGYSRQREVKLTGGGIAVSVVAALLVAGGVAAGILLNSQANRESETHRLLARQAMHADATITRLWRSSGKDRQSWVSYRFEYGGAIYDKRMKVPRRIWSGLKEGSSLPIQFLPSNPMISQPEAWEDRPLPLWVPYLVGALLILPAGLLAESVRRQVHLLAEGRPAQGVVTRHTRVQKGRTRHDYEFRLLSGAVAKGRAERNRAIAIGAPVCIIYDPDNPRRNSIYPLPFVRPANVRRPDTRR